MAFTSSELKAAALLVLAVWLLVPLFKKLCRAVSNERKLRHLPGPRPGLFGVAPILKVLAAKALVCVLVAARGSCLSAGWLINIVCMSCEQNVQAGDFFVVILLYSPKL